MLHVAREPLDTLVSSGRRCSPVHAAMYLLYVAFLTAFLMTNARSAMIHPCVQSVSDSKLHKQKNKIQAKSTRGTTPPSAARPLPLPHTLPSSLHVYSPNTSIASWFTSLAAAACALPLTACKSPRGSSTSPSASASARERR